MNNQLPTSEILTDEDLHFSHKFILTRPYTLTCLSTTLCDLLGYTEQEISDLFNNQYTLMVYPEDRERYLRYIDQLATGEQTMALRYRMVKKNGDIIYISDIMFSHLKQDGKLYGFAVIVDITDTIKSQALYSMLNLPPSVIPFGYLQCTCEKYPKVLYINDQMLSFLNASPESHEWKEFLHDNIFFMIPFEDRDLFREYLNTVQDSQEPIKIHHQIMKSSGERAEVVGWLGTIVNEQGLREYSIIYTDIENPQRGYRKETDNSYFRALESAYNVIFELNLSRQTVECIYGKDTSDLGKLYDVHMTLESAAQFWLNNYIVPEDREHMDVYFRQITTPGVVAHAKNPMQTEFRIAWDDEVIYSFVGVSIQLDSSSILFCCRDTAKVQYSSLQAREIRSLKKLHRYMDLLLETDKNARGGIIFERDDDDCCSLLYASKTMFDFLHWRYDQYLHYLEDGFHLSNLQALATAYNIPDIEELFAGKRFTIHLEESDEDVTLCCSHHSDNLYEILAIKQKPQSVGGVPSTGIFARTFGYFDLFVDGVPVIFSNYKEKELMALLIDRNGGTITSNDAIGYLWEDELVDERLRTRFRKLAMGLKRTLQKYNADHILINHNGTRSVDTGAFLCDYYELLAGNAHYVQSFHNSYMSDYTWSEHTLGTLWDFS